jgi:hypothetical protein
MKKQLLIVLLALFAISYSSVFGQAVHNDPPQPITCPTDATHPIAGTPFDYSALISPLLGNAYWYATTATTFMTGGARPASIEQAVGGPIVAAATNYMNMTPAPSSPSTTSITWTSDGLAAHTVTPTANPTLFVVIQYTAPSTACADNLKVFPIRPINAFVVDIQSMQGSPSAPAGYGTVVGTCFAGVQSAVYDGTSNLPDGSVIYDFGTNYLYYEMVAANFTASYTPSFKISGLQGNQVADIDWGYTIGTYSTNVTTGTGNGTYASASPATTLLTNTSTGVSIYVRVSVHNLNFEGTAQTPITFAVEGINSAAQHDVDNATCGYTAPGFEDLIVQNLNPRPTLTPNGPPAFLPIKP